MSAKYAIQFSLMSIAAAIAAWVAVSAPAQRFVLLWAAVAFAFVAIAYASGRPTLLMKRADGSQPILAWLLLWPYFLLARLSFGLYRALHRKRFQPVEVVPGLWFSRRLTRSEARSIRPMRPSVLDLAAELPRAAVECDGYRSLPLLDGAPPSEQQLRDGCAWIRERLDHGPVLVHCALGHGRTGSVILAWLLLHGHVSDVEAGIARLRSLRRGFGLSTAQKTCVERWVAASAGVMPRMGHSD